jgi:carbon storage regulator
MLVLSRTAGERVMIDHEITVTVLQIEGGKVRLGIDAPKAVQVHREETYRAIHGHQKGGENEETPRHE